MVNGHSDLGRLATAAGAIPVVACLLWIPAALAMPLGRDQGIFAWVAETVLRGGLPYADAFDVKGPAAYGFYALALTTFGVHAAAIRLFDLVMLGLAGTGMILLSNRLGGAWLGLVATALTVCFMRGDFWNTAQPDGWAAVLLLWSVLLVTLDEPGPGIILAAAFLVGCATLVKPQYAAFAGILIAATCWGRPWKQIVLRLLLIALGAILPAAACVLIYAQADKLSSLSEVVSFDLLVHANHNPWGLRRALAATGATLDIWPPRFSLGPQIAAVAGYRYLHRQVPGLARTLLAGVTLGLLTAVSQNKFYLYHFSAFFVFLSPLAAFGLPALAGDGYRTVRSIPVRAVALLLLLVFPAAAVRPSINAGRWWGFAVGWLGPAAYERGFNYTDFRYADVAAAARTVARLTPECAPIYVWGFDALVYFMADRPSAWRLGYDYPILASPPGRRNEIQDRLIAVLRRHPPAAIVVETSDRNNLMPQTSLQALSGFLAMLQLLGSTYWLAYCNPSFLVFVRVVCPRTAAVSEPAIRWPVTAGLTARLTTKNLRASLLPGVAAVSLLQTTLRHPHRQNPNWESRTTGFIDLWPKPRPSLEDYAFLDKPKNNLTH